MFRLVAAVLAGLVGAAIVHIAVVFAMPWVASNNSWSRLARLGPIFAAVRIEPQRNPVIEGSAPASGSPGLEFAFVDPAFLTASCRFDLSGGPVRMTGAGTPDFWSASIYTRRGDNLYSINDRSAVGRTFDLLVGSAEQLVDSKATSPDPNETTIPIEFGEIEGYMTIRVLVDEESMRPEAEEFMRSLRCAADEEAEADPAGTG